MLDVHPPRVENNLGFVFVNFDCISHIYIDFCQHTMFTTKTSGLCKGASKQTPDPPL